MTAPVPVYLVWSELRDGACIVHQAHLDKETAEQQVRRCTDRPMAPCGCCEDASPADVLGIKRMWIDCIFAS